MITFKIKEMKIGQKNLEKLKSNLKMLKEQKS